MRTQQAAESALKTVLRPLYRPPRAVFQYFRGGRINKVYASHYARAQRLYEADGHRSEPTIKIGSVGVHVATAGAAEPWLHLPSTWAESIARIGRDVDRRFAQTTNCLFIPKVDRSSLPTETADVPAVRRGEVISIQLRHPLDLDGLNELCEALLPQIERIVYGSYVLVDKVYVYRNLMSHQREQVSWLWHYDNHPAEILKVMIYLTDVGEQNAPFEYIRSDQTHQALCFEPRPLMGNSRVAPDRVKKYLATGYECHKATGPRGTVVLFDDNALHKANIARERHRDAIVLQLRPAHFRPRPYVDAKWTGSFDHDDFSQNPYDHSPRPKAYKLSG